MSIDFVPFFQVSIFMCACNFRPICRRVSDSVHVLDAIVGYDPLDEATKTASKHIPKGGYKQFLRANGLKGKRLGVIFGSLLDHHIKTLR